MSTVIQFRGRSVTGPSSRISSDTARPVSDLASNRAQRECHVPVRQPKQVIDPRGDIRELAWVSPLENGLIQALFSGLESASAYLLEQAEMPPASYTYRANDLFDGWRSLWISATELDLFNYIQNFGIRAAAELLAKRARELHVDEKAAIARARKRAVREVKSANAGRV